MSGKLPGARPVSSDYGPTVIDRVPVKDPQRQTSASTWNDIKSDAAYAARMCPLLRIRITNNGAAAAVASVVGPEGVLTSQVTVSRTSQGIVAVDWSATSVSADDVFAVARHATQHRMAGVVGLSPTGCTVFCESRTVSGGVVALDDSDITLLVF
jgi:hypothetical protein